MELWWDRDNAAVAMTFTDDLRRLGVFRVMRFRGNVYILAKKFLNWAGVELLNTRVFDVFEYEDKLVFQLGKGKIKKTVKHNS